MGTAGLHCNRDGAHQKKLNNRTERLTRTGIGTSVANERTLSYMKYVTEQRPSLPTHQEVVACMTEQTVFGLLDFPLENAQNACRHA